MKRCALFCAAWFWAFLLIPLALLLPLLFMQWHAIENDVASNAADQLQAADMQWAKVLTFNRGRDVLLTGTPPDTASIDKARSIAKTAYGVNRVDISTDVTPPAIPAELNAIITGESVVLRGTLKDQASIDQILAQANAAFGPDNVLNRLVVGDNTEALPDLNGFFRGLAGKAVGLSTLTASLSDNALTLKGSVANDEVKSELDSAMQKLFSGQVSNQLIAVAPPPVKRDVCQDLVNDILGDGKINFETGKATITVDSHPLLNRLGDTAKRCPDARFEVAGHTDSIGDLESNMSLSERRAQAVVDYLIELGLNPEQFTSAGYGPNQPIGDNQTSEGRARNRRIEFKLKD